MLYVCFNANGKLVTFLFHLFQVKLQRSEIGHFGPKDILSGSWKTSDDDSGIDVVEYCFGTIEDGCNVQDFRRALKNVTNATCQDCKLKHKKMYFMSVRVWNNAGLFNFLTSKGVIVDLTAPVGGEVSLKKTYTSCIGSCKLTAEFSGFKDEESGVESCEFGIKSVGNRTVTPAQPVTNGSQIEANNLILEHGESYKMAVACYNTIGERSVDVFSSPVKIDNTPPEMVRVFRLKINIYIAHI